jgi:hypothetical protein
VEELKAVVAVEKAAFWKQRYYRQSVIDGMEITFCY